VRGGGAEEEAARGFPREPSRLRDALMPLGPGELTIAAVVGLIAPDACALRQHGILAREHPRIIGPPPAAVDDDLVAHLHVRDVLARGPYDARAVAAARVEVLRLAQLLPLRNDVQGLAEGRPDIVVVDPRGHHVDEHLVRADGGRGDDLALPGLTRLAEAVLADEVAVHPRGDFSQRRLCSWIVEICHSASDVVWPNGPGTRRACARRRPSCRACGLPRGAGRQPGSPPN